MLHTKAISVKAAIMLMMLVIGINVNAQDWKKEKKVNILFGLTQPIVGHGFNIEANYISKRMIFDFSQGVSLVFKDGTVPKELRQQGVAVHMPWTTGIGIGYRLTEWLNVRVEPKWHRFEFYYENEKLYQGSQITAYNTFTLGVGVYGNYQPFKKKSNFLNGITIAPSIRFWPTVSSTLKGNNFTYFNQYTKADERIKTYGPGTELTPLIINVSIGYSFKWRRKN